MQDATTFDGKFGISHTQFGSAPGVGYELSLSASPLSLLPREREWKWKGEFTSKTCTSLALLLTWGPDQLNLTPVSFQV